MVPVLGVVAGGWGFLWGVGFLLRVLCSCWGGWCGSGRECCGCLCSHVLGCRVVWFTRLGVVLVWWPGLGLGQQAGRQRVPGMNPRKGIRMFDLHAAEAQVREAAEAVRTIVGMPVTQVDVHQVLQVEENVATQVVITGRYTKDVLLAALSLGTGTRFWWGGRLTGLRSRRFLRVVPFTGL